MFNEPGGQVGIQRIIVTAALAVSFSLGASILPSPVGPSVAFAASDASAVIKAVETKYKDVEVMHAQFVQVSKSELVGEDTQKGKLTLKRPTKMRWEFEGDGKQFVTDGSTMWIFNATQNQVIVYKDFSATAGTADSLLQSLDKLSEHFEVTMLESAEPGHKLELTPKKEGQVKSVTLSLTPELLVRGVIIVDPYGTVTELSFTDMKLAGEFPDSHFQFVVPEGAEVIDASG